MNKKKAHGPVAKQAGPKVRKSTYSTVPALTPIEFDSPQSSLALKSVEVPTICPREVRKFNTEGEKAEADLVEMGSGIAASDTTAVGTSDATVCGADSPGTTESFARETSSGPVGDLSTWSDGAVLSGMKQECEAFRALDANYPGRCHRLGTFIRESKKRLGEEATRAELRGQGINKTMAHWAERIAELYTYDQAVQFPSARAIIRTLPPRQPRSPKKNPKAGLIGGDHRGGAPSDPPQVPAAVTEETLLERFVQLGIEVRQLFGEDALDKAVERIKAHIPETFEQVFAEV